MSDYVFENGKEMPSGKVELTQEERISQLEEKVNRMREEINIISDRLRGVHITKQIDPVLKYSPKDIINKYF